ncbi:hypothetical protein C8Q80DRAFT_1265732 [Daedaleopsis nitida]|nr:hypothetical protein C8Q80DRAFT_1265732 [Daedaleopsis nitida]
MERLGSSLTSPIHVVPTEIWDKIIDLVVLDSNTEAIRDPRTYARTMRTCALVCRTWHPRAHHNLYSRVCITETTPGGSSTRTGAGTVTGTGSGAGQLAQYMRTIASQPHLADAASEWYIVPKPPDVDDAPARIAWMTAWMGALPRRALRRMTLEDIDWRYPSALFTQTLALCPRGSGLRELHLRRVAFESGADLLRLLCRLPGLAGLSLLELKIACKTSEGARARLLGLPEWPSEAAPATLERLSVSVNALAKQGALTLLSAFGGSSLRTLSLEVSDRKHWDLEGMGKSLELREFLKELKCVEEVEIKAHLGPSRTGWGRLQKTILSAIHPERVTVMNMDLLDVDLYDWAYGMSRIAMANALCTGESTNLDRYAKLESFTLSLVDDGRFYNSEWWNEHIQDDLPRRLAAIVRVRAVHSMWGETLWKSDGYQSSGDEDMQV